MFKRPKANELHPFFKFHPIQVLCKTVKKTFFGCYGNRRYWIIYWEDEHLFFCSVCLAFVKTNDESKFITEMIATSKQFYCRIEDHENSKNDLNATESYAMRIKDKDINSLLFTDLLTKRTEEVKYRRTIFERVVDVIKLIGKRGVSF